MATFIVRVELRGNPTWQDYENLHKAMLRQGLSQTVRDSSGADYVLPHATYATSRFGTAKEAANAANNAASSVWSDHCLIASGDTWNSWNLKRT